MRSGFCAPHPDDERGGDEPLEWLVHENPPSFRRFRSDQSASFTTMRPPHPPGSNNTPVEVPAFVLAHTLTVYEPAGRPVKAENIEMNCVVAETVMASSFESPDSRLLTRIAS